jgi:two-component sensor histidine kinase
MSQILLAAASLSDLESRLRSISLVHELLYKNENLARINLHHYLDGLLQDLRYSVGAGRDIRYIVRTERNQFRN